MATNLYLADSQEYITADTMDDAVTKYFQDKGVYPTSIALFKDSTFLITESTVVAVTPEVLPAGAVTAGATVSPSTPVYIKEGDQITLTATGAGAFPTFVNWEIDSVEVSTDNPYTHTATDIAVTISANFSA